MPPTKRAVLVGVNEYRDSRIPRLKGAVNDATEVCARLREFGDFEVAPEHLLLDKDATCQNIRKGISDLLWKVDPCDLTVFYFSGHGLQDSAGNGYISPHDIQSDEPFVCGIRMQELRELILASRNKESIVVILDCCYSGIATEGKGETELAADDPRVDHWFSPFAEEMAGRGKVILASSGKDQKSHELCRGHELGREAPHDHGVFTFHLLEGLDGRASDSDDITLDGLRRYIDLQLQDDPQHKLTLFGAGLSQADQIKIAKAGRRRDFRKWLTDADGYLQKGHPSTIFKAAKILGRVLEGSPKFQDAINLRVLIDAKLAEFRGPATVWMLNHLIDISSDFPDICKFLQYNLNRLSVEVILKAPEERRTLLASLCEVGLGRLDEEDFFVQLRAAVQASPAAVAETPLSGDRR